MGGGRRRKYKEAQCRCIRRRGGEVVCTYTGKVHMNETHWYSTDIGQSTCRCFPF